LLIVIVFIILIDNYGGNVQIKLFLLWSWFNPKSELLLAVPFDYAAPALRLRGPRGSPKGSDRVAEGQGPRSRTAPLCEIAQILWGSNFVLLPTGEYSRGFGIIYYSFLIYKNIKKYTKITN